MKFSKPLLFLLALGLCGMAQAQLPKLNKGSISKKANSAVKSQTSDVAGDAQRHTENLNKHNTKLKGLVGSPKWSDDAFVKDFQYTMGYFAGDLASAEADPGGKPAYKKFEPNFQEYLALYQADYDLTDQTVFPITKDDETKKAIVTAFRQVVFPYKQLKKREAMEKAKWGDQEWVDDYAKHLADFDAKTAVYKTTDPANQGKIERYEAAKAPLQALFDERKEFPARRKEYSEFINSKNNDYKVMKEAAENGFANDEAFLKAVQNFEWAKNRAQMAFLNEWDFTVMSYSSNMDYLRTFTNDWPAGSKPALNKAMADILAATSSEKYAYSRYMQALRYQNLSEAATLLYPEDKAVTAKLAEAKTLLAAKKKEYETETFTSDHHKNNTYTIGFSSTGAKGFSPKKSITAGEKFVFTLFFDRPIALIYPEGELYFKLDGPWDEEEQLHLKLRPEDMDKSYLDYTVFGDNPFPDPEEDKTQEFILRELARVKGKSGKVTLKVSARSNVDKRQTPEGSFQFDGTNAAGIAKYDAKRVGLTDVRLADVRMPKAGKTDAALAATMKKVFMDKYGEQDVVEVTRVVITSTDWSVKRNEFTGIILSRHISAAIAYTRIDGTCRYEDAGFAQEHQGGGKYGPTYWNGVGDNVELSCKNVNK